VAFPADPLQRRDPEVSVTAAQSPCVAIVDADDAIGEGVRTALEAVGFGIEEIRLGDFPNGKAGWVALAARGVDLIVYEAGARFREDPTRFQEFCVARVGRAIPLLITTLTRALLDEQANLPERVLSMEDTVAVQHLIRAIRREQPEHQQDSEALRPRTRLALERSRHIASLRLTEEPLAISASSARLWHTFLQC
jgi:hypothetical protein